MPAGSIEARLEAHLEAIGLALPAAPSPVANYVPAVVAGGFLYISGQLPRDASGAIVTGRLGAGLGMEQGQAAARLAALAVLAQAKAALGSLDRIERVVRLTAFVNSTPDFHDHPQVVNGASDLLVAVLGEKGRHTRSSVGAASLPGNAAIEIDAIFLVEQ